MRARILYALGGVVVLAFAAVYFGSPWVAAWDLMRAARDRDVPALETHVDMPAVRASLKSQLDDRLERSLEKHAGRDGPLAELGALVGAALVDKAVDSAVTPEALAQVVRTARAPDPRKSAPPPPDADAPDLAAGDAPEDAPHDSAKPPKIKADLALKGLNRFDIRLSPADEPDRRLTLIMHRQGLFGWKVTDVELPK